MVLLFLFFLGTYGYVFPKLSNTRILLLPGYGCDKEDYRDMINTCDKWNIELDVVPIHRFEWLRVSTGLLDKNYWNYNIEPSSMFNWYLNKSKTALFNSVSKNNDKPIVLCGHSAGGWLARILMNNGTLYKEQELQTNHYINTLLTMGSPHNCHDNKNLDPTHGCLTYVNKHFPGSYLRKYNIKYITLGSKAKPVFVNKTNGFKNNIVKNSYMSVLGKTDSEIIEGDSIVPIESSHLKNSIQMNFEDVYHFPRNGKKYYWESSIMKQWFEILEDTI